MSDINLTIDVSGGGEHYDSKSALIVHQHENDIQADSLLASSIGGNYLAYTSKGIPFFN